MKTLLPALIPINPPPHLAEAGKEVTEGSLTHLQKQRKAFGIAYQGEQTAVICFSLYENAPGQSRNQKAFYAPLPDGIDVKNPDKIISLMESFEYEKIQTKGSNTVVVNCVFMPPINAAGETMAGEAVTKVIDIKPLALSKSPSTTSSIEGHTRPPLPSPENRKIGCDKA